MIAADLGARHFHPDAAADSFNLAIDHLEAQGVVLGATGDIDFVGGLITLAVEAGKVDRDQAHRCRACRRW